MARTSNTDERRAQIAAALRRVMARKGYDGASIGDVAVEAGLTAGLVHYHFASKLEILLAVLAELARTHEARVAAALAGDRGAGARGARAQEGGVSLREGAPAARRRGGRALEGHEAVALAAGVEDAADRAPLDPVAAVGAFIDVHLSLGGSADPEALACWVMLAGEALREPRVREAFEAVLARLVGALAAVIRRGTKAKVLSARDPSAAAAAIVAAIQGYFVLAATARDLVPRGSAAPAVRAMAAGLLGAPALAEARAPQRRRS